MASVLNKHILIYSYVTESGQHGYADILQSNNTSWYV